MICKIISIALIFVLNSDASTFQLTTSEPNGTVGNDFTFICNTTSNYILISTDSQHVCLIYNVTNNGSCIFDYYNKNYTYKCDRVNGIYLVTIPGSYIDRLHRSRWMCQYVFGGEYSNSITLHVNIPVSSVTLSSTVKGENPVTIIENKNQRFECKTSPIRPTGRIQWYISSKNMTDLAVAQPDTWYTYCSDDKVISSSVLVYKGNRSDNGKFLHCNAMNVDTQYGVGSNKKQLIILYGPASINYSPKPQSHSILEGETFGPVYCLSSCNPNCEYMWTGVGINITKSELLIEDISRIQAGHFKCSAYNSVGTFKKNIDVMVKYPPNVIHLNISSADLTVRENSNVTLSCEADGNPVPIISWYFINSFGLKTLLHSNKTGYSELKIVKAKCEDTGRFLCTADNALFPSSTKMVDLNVTCFPRRERVCPSYNQIRTNGEISLTTCWISNPSPEVVWRFLNGIHASENTTTNSAVYRNTSILYTNIFQTRIVDETQQEFHVFARNNFGSSEAIYIDIIIPANSQHKSQTNKAGTTDTNRFLDIGIGFFTGMVCCVLTFVIILRIKTKRKKQQRTNEYTEFQLHGSIEVNSYDTIGQKKAEEPVEVKTQLDETKRINIRL